uniref:Uncharacterized protein n=1 Tax=Knipowitschia caucasica TaxID=637954 RepID=A0AAV2KPP9_KNICA
MSVVGCSEVGVSLRWCPIGAVPHPSPLHCPASALEEGQSGTCSVVGMMYDESGVSITVPALPKARRHGRKDQEPVKL